MFNNNIIQFYTSSRQMRNIKSFTLLQLLPLHGTTGYYYYLFPFIERVCLLDETVCARAE